MTDNQSYRSHSSYHSWCSSRASAVGASYATAQAKAEAAKAHLALVEKKLKIKMKELQLEKEIATAVAEAETLKAVADKWNGWLSQANVSTKRTNSWTLATL